MPPLAAAAESGPARSILEAEAGERRSYGHGAGILSIGIATTGIVTFAYFAVASHVLPEVQYKGISLLWSVMFVVISIIYRPIEQLLSRTIAERRAQGHEQHPYRVPVDPGQLRGAVRGGRAGPGPIRTRSSRLGSSTGSSWALAYAASYFARGRLAGMSASPSRRARLPDRRRASCSPSPSRWASPAGGSRGARHRRRPFVSLVVVPWAFSRRKAGGAARQAEEAQDRGFHGARHGLRSSVLVIMWQMLLNAAVIAPTSPPRRRLAGFVFNVLLIARAPLQLFQSIQTCSSPT